MRIDDKNMLGIGTPGVGGAAGTPETGASRTRDARGVGSPSGPDHVELSGLAEELRAQQQGSEAREAELERLRQLHLAGEYQPDVEEVAGRLVEEAVRETAAERPVSRENS